MANIPSKPSYTHGSTGTTPNTALNYAKGDPVDADNLDYFINTPLETLKTIIDVLNAIDSDDDGRVDAADKATNVESTYKGNDIDADSDGVVDAADHVETGGSPAKIKDTTNNIDLLTAIENGPIKFGVNADVDGNDIEDSGTTIYDTSGGHIEQSILENDDVTIAGNKVNLGGSTTIAHGDLSNAPSSAHHSKTSSASELTDVSPDSTSNAHHTEPKTINALDNEPTSTADAIIASIGG